MSKYIKILIVIILTALITAQSSEINNDQANTIQEKPDRIISNGDIVAMIIYYSLSLILIVACMLFINTKV